jgi:hypothetical protein
MELLNADEGEQADLERELTKKRKDLRLRNINFYFTLFSTPSPPFIRPVSR